jgi:hypothetical protein
VLSACDGTRNPYGGFEIDDFGGLDYVGRSAGVRVTV